MQVFKQNERVTYPPLLHTITSPFYFLLQMNLQKLKSVPAGPYTVPLRLLVIAVGPRKSFTNEDGTVVPMISVGAAQEEDAVKLVVYGTKNVDIIRVGRPILLKRYAFRNGSVSVRQNELLYRAADGTVSDSATTAARHIVNPESPKKTIRQVLEDPSREMATVEGIVIKVCIISHPIHNMLQRLTSVYHML